MRGFELSGPGPNLLMLHGVHCSVLRELRRTSSAPSFIPIRADWSVQLYLSNYISWNW